MDVEAEILANLRGCSKEFVQLRGRHAALFGGDVSPVDPVSTGLQALPPWLDQLCRAVANTGAFTPSVPPNHVLVNHYQPGEGIMAHEDGPKYAPHAAILSLGTGVVFDFWKTVADASGRGAPPALSLVLPPRSLFIFEDEAYRDYLHGIADRDQDILKEGLQVNGDSSHRGAWIADGWLGKQSSTLGDNGATLLRGERYSLTFRHARAPGQLSHWGAARNQRLLITELNEWTE